MLINLNNLFIYVTFFHDFCGKSLMLSNNNTMCNIPKYLKYSLNRKIPSHTMTIAKTNKIFILLVY